MREDRALCHLDHSLRNRVLSITFIRTMRDWRIFVDIICIASFALLFSWLPFKFQTTFGLSATGFAVLAASCAAILFITLYWVSSRAIARRRRYLSGVCHEHNIRPRACLICGYDLRGSTSDTCPECGAPLAAVVVGAGDDDDTITEVTR